MFGLLSGSEGSKGILRSCQSGPISGKDIMNKSSASGKHLPGAGKQQVLLVPRGFNSTGSNMVASVNAQPVILECSLVKVSIKLNPWSCLKVSLQKL